MLLADTVLNDTYKIIEPIGSGGGGIVYKAYHLRLEKEVAVKLIKENVKGALNERAEADILKRLKHEGLPQIYDFVSDGENVYTVMEYIDGGSLCDEIIRQKRLSVSRTIRLSKELCAAAAYLHSRKPPIVHSDIKPQNIMLTVEGRLCLIDFNISSVLSAEAYTIGSSDGYSPPEQYIAKSAAAANRSAAASGSDKTELDASYDPERTVLLSELPQSALESGEKHSADKSIIVPASDVYSIGAVMYSMLTGRRPQNSRSAVTPIKELLPDIPEPLAAIIEKAMSKDKQKRFPTAAAMLTALENIGRLDKRYRSLAIKQQIAMILCPMLLAGSVITSIAGYRLMGAENEDRYNGYITELDELAAAGSTEDFEELFERVTAQYPDKTEPYYYRAAILYANSEHLAAKECITERLLPDITSLDAAAQANTYFMLADILSEDGDDKAAVEYYALAAEYPGASADIYRDYSAALARSGDISSAEQMLEKARSLGISEDGILMTNGEILLAEGSYSKAADCFKQAISLTDDDILMRNAYLLCSDAYKSQYEGDGSGDIILENIALLEQGILELPQELSMQLRENLAQAYIDYGEVSAMVEYYAKAVNLLLETRRLGWSDYQTEMNIAVLCSRIGNYADCKQLLLEMAATPEYELHYFTIYTRIAYCEASLQSDKEVSDRSYAEFDKYYHAAAEAYKAYTANGNSDPEMEKLTQLREEIAALGWLK